MSTPVQNAPLSDSGTATEKQLRDLQVMIKQSQAKLKVFQARLAAKPTAAQKSAYTALFKAESKKLEALTNRATTLQNRYYEQTGDYEKLLEGANRDAFLAVSTLFKSYDLESLAGKVYEYVKNGYSADTIAILLQDTPEYKERFAGNELRKKAGLPVLNPAEYLATESSYRQIMQSAGLPSGFYDSPRDFDMWISKNVSPTEIQSRVELATQATVLSNPTYRKALNQMGIQDSELTAYFLDPDRALPYLQKSAATAAIGAAAIDQGLGFDARYAADLATKGVTAEEARSGYSQIASEAQTLSNLGAIYGEEYSQRTGEEAILGGNAQAINKRQRLINNEKGQFSGSAGTGRGGLAQSGGAR